MVAKVMIQNIHGYSTHIVTIMHRNKSSSTWMVQKLIERDHMNHHYRRLNGAQSHLHLSNYRNSTVSKNRLSKSTNDVRFEDSLRNVENRMASDFCLNVSPPASEKKKEISDETLDVMTRHSKYFTQPKHFTPRLVRKIVRPNTSPTNRPLSVVRPMKLEATENVPVKMVSSARKTKKVIIPENPQRNVSDDSAFGDEQSIESSISSSSSESSQEMDVFNIKQWLREQEEENCYMQLMCDITADLLQRSLCTNGNMKEIIAIYIRKSRKKFSVGKEILMKRLCEDLMIPNDNGFDGQFYGSKCTVGSSTYSYQTRRDKQEDIRIFYNEIKTTDNLPEVAINQNEVVPNKNHRYENVTAKRPSILKSQTSELESPELDWFEDKPFAPLKNEENALKNLANSQQAAQMINNTCQKPDMPDLDGYFSDFTNDTDNDIEEEFDFD